MKEPVNLAPHQRKIVDMLRELLADAEAGGVDETFILVRGATGEVQHQMVSLDTPDMLFELGSAMMLEQINCKR